jgi:putative redox protein
MTATYDASQHCTATASSKGKSVAMDCPYTGKGEELSPGELLEAALAGCMLMSMGAVAKRDGIDLTGSAVDVELVGTPPPKTGYQAINAIVRMPVGIQTSDRTKLERAADACPIKHSFDPSIEVAVVFEYPD